MLKLCYPLRGKKKRRLLLNGNDYLVDFHEHSNVKKIDKIYLLKHQDFIIEEVEFVANKLKKDNLI